MKHARGAHRLLAAGLIPAAALFGGAAGAVLGSCGPFTHFTDAGFCPYVLEICPLGITTGTTPTTYDPASPVSRLQMAAFLSRTVDGVLKRGSRRAALDQYWTTQDAAAFGVTTVGLSPGLPKSDGLDIWVPRLGFVTRVRAADGKVLEDWSGALNAFAALSAMGRVFVTGMTNPGELYEIFPNHS